MNLKALFPMVALLCVSCDRVSDVPPSALESSPSAGAPQMIAETPEILIEGGTSAADQALYRVVTPFLLPDNRLVVPQDGNKTVSVYSPEGRFELAFGREGNGPGDFRSIRGAWAHGDTVEVFDGALQRVSRFLSGDLVNVVTLRPAGSVETSVPGRLQDGWVFGGLVNSRPSAEPFAGVRRDVVAFRWFGLDGTDRGEIARALGLSRYFSEEQRTLPEPLAAGSAAGIAGELLFTGETLEPRIVGVDARGQIRSELTWVVDDGPAPSEALRLVLELDAAGRDVAGTPRLQLSFPGAPIPPSIPVFHGFLLDSEGFVWVLPYAPDRHAHALGGWRGTGPGGTWLVFDADGAKVAEVDMPDRLYPSQITENRVVGIQRDVLGTETVAVYRLTRRIE